MRSLGCFTSFSSGVPSVILFWLPLSRFGFPGVGARQCECFSYGRVLVSRLRALAIQAAFVVVVMVVVVVVVVVIVVIVFGFISFSSSSYSW